MALFVSHHRSSGRSTFEHASSSYVWHNLWEIRTKIHEKICTNIKWKHVMKATTKDLSNLALSISNIQKSFKKWTLNKLIIIFPYHSPMTQLCPHLLAVEPHIYIVQENLRPFAVLAQPLHSILIFISSNGKLEDKILA